MGTAILCPKSHGFSATSSSITMTTRSSTKSRPLFLLPAYPEEDIYEEEEDEDGPRFLCIVDLENIQAPFQLVFDSIPPM